MGVSVSKSLKCLAIFARFALKKSQRSLRPLYLIFLVPVATAPGTGVPPLRGLSGVNDHGSGINGDSVAGGLAIVAALALKVPNKSLRPPRALLLKSLTPLKRLKGLGRLVPWVPPSAPPTAKGRASLRDFGCCLPTSDS
jgi:hypothetical protein